MLSRKRKQHPPSAEIRTGGVDSILAKLFRTITFKDLKMEIDRYHALMENYLRKMQLNANRVEKQDARIGLSRELMCETMTWKTFMDGLRFLNVVSFEIDLLGFYPDNSVSRHIHNVEITDRENEGEILSEFFIKMEAERGIDQEAFSELLDAYILRSRVNPKKKERAAIRASLTKELLNTSMTWRSFVKGLSFFGMARFTLTLTLRHRSGRLTRHFVKVVLDDYTEE